jgi:hypothetical protein
MIKLKRCFESKAADRAFPPGLPGLGLIPQRGLPETTAAKAAAAVGCRFTVLNFTEGNADDAI